MATKTDVIERDGRKIAIYDNGMERDAETGRIVKPAPSSLLTSETASLLQRKRQEKAAAALRKRILEATQKRSTVTLSGSAEAVAEAGGFIWDEVVMGEDVYPRDRLDAWEKLSKYAGVLPADIRRDSDTAQTVANAAAVGVAVASVMERVLRDVMQAQQGDVVDGEATDDG